MMPVSCTRPRSAATIAALAGVALAALTACGGGGRAAAAVPPSISGSVVTDESTDLGSIVIGWGETHSNTEITTPRPDEVSARCHGRGEQLAVDIRGPSRLEDPRPPRVPETRDREQRARPRPRADVDTTNKYLDTL